MVDIRGNVKRLCKLQGITQKDLAVKIGITEIALNTSLKPTGNPSVKTIGRIAEGLGVTLAEIFAEEGSAEQKVIHSPYARCPHCGGKIEVYVKAVGGEEHNYL